MYSLHILGPIVTRWLRNIACVSTIEMCREGSTVFVFSQKCTFFDVIAKICQKYEILYFSKKSKLSKNIHENVFVLALAYRCWSGGTSGGVGGEEGRGVISIFEPQSCPP